VRSVRAGSDDRLASRHSVGAAPARRVYEDTLNGFL
jgi:hypothetical protein